jgi:hypothetical protein
MADLVKQGDKYVGKSNEGFSCRYPDVWYGWNRPHTNTCHRDSGIELQFVSPARMEGKFQNLPSDNKFNCKPCADSKEPVWQTFTWIPDR